MTLHCCENAMTTRIIHLASMPIVTVLATFRLQLDTLRVNYYEA